MLATQQQIAQGLVDHPPEHYDLTEPYKRMPYDFRRDSLVWCRVGDDWKKGRVEYVSGAQVAVILEGETQPRYFQYTSHQIWFRTI